MLGGMQRLQNRWHAHVDGGARCWPHFLLLWLFAPRGTERAAASTRYGGPLVLAVAVGTIDVAAAFAVAVACPIRAPHVCDRLLEATAQLDAVIARQILLLALPSCKCH